MGVRRLRTLLEEHYGAAFTREAIPEQCTLVIDGNNFAHFMARGLSDYAELHRKVEDTVAHYRQQERRVVVIFDGVVKDATSRMWRASAMESRSDARGEAASRALYEGGDAKLPLAMEQVACSLKLLGVEVHRAQGEADESIAAICLSNKAFAVSDDSDLAIFAGLQLLRLSTISAGGELTGVVWRRESIARAMGFEESAVVELCLALGTDEIEPQEDLTPQPPHNPIAVLRWFVGLNPFFVAADPEDPKDVDRLLTTVRSAWEHPQSRLQQEAGHAYFEDEAALASLVLEELTPALAPYLAVALRRVVDGERSTSNAHLVVAEAEAAHAFQRRCRDLLRSTDATLAPLKIFDHGTFAAICAELRPPQDNSWGGATATRQQDDSWGGAIPSSFRATATEWSPSPEETVSADILLSANSQSWAPSVQAPEWGGGAPASRAMTPTAVEWRPTVEDEDEVMSPEEEATYEAQARGFEEEAARGYAKARWFSREKETPPGGYARGFEEAGYGEARGFEEEEAPSTGGYGAAQGFEEATGGYGEESPSTYVAALEAYCVELETLCGTFIQNFGRTAVLPQRPSRDDYYYYYDQQEQQQFGSTTTTTTQPAASQNYDQEQQQFGSTTTTQPAASYYDQVGSPTEPAASYVPASSLPIDAAREEIVLRVAQSACTIVRGETGSGKSTRLPRFLLATSPHAKVVVAQPRRLAALQLYERAVAEGGASVGVRVGMSGAATSSKKDRREYDDEQDDVEEELVRRSSDDTRLWYMTSGVCAKLMCHRPEFFDDVTHLCVDEVHERDVDTDVVLALCRERFVLKRSTTRVILLSATLDARLLERYFQCGPPIDVQGRRFELKRHSLEDLATAGKDWGLGGAWMPPKAKKAKAALLKMTSCVKQDEEHDTTTISRALVMHQLELAVWIVRALGAGGGSLNFTARAVVVFVSGISEIAELSDRFEQLGGETNGNVDYVVSAIHSELPFEAQRAALFGEEDEEEDKDDKRRSDVRVVRVILATNAAESSLTLPDVDAVVDCCSRKLPCYDRATDRVVLRHVWSSQATAKQRAGRTGRLGPGVAYHLASSRLLSSLRDHDEAAVESQPLDQVVLGLRASMGGKVAPLLRNFPTPPSDTHLADALQMLARRGLLVENNASSYEQQEGDERISRFDGGALTTAGSLAAALPIDLRLSRLVVLGASLGCLSEALDLAAALSQPAPLWTSPLPVASLYADVRDQLVATKIALLGRRRFDARRRSEPLALLAALNAYRAAQSPAEKHALCATYSLNGPRLKQLDLYARALRRRLQVRFPNVILNDDANFDDEKKQRTLLRFLLASAFWDQSCVLETSPTAAASLASKAPRNVKLRSNDNTALQMREIAPLFPPIVGWRLHRRHLIKATGVLDCSGAAYTDVEAQNALWRRLTDLASLLESEDTRFIVANFGDDRLVVAKRRSGSSQSFETVYDGAAASKGTMRERVDTLLGGPPRTLKLWTGPGTVTLETSNLREDNQPLSLLFGEGASWITDDTTEEQATYNHEAGVHHLEFLLLQKDDDEEAVEVDEAKGEPPVNGWGLGLQLLSTAVLAATKAKTLRLPASSTRDTAQERARAKTVGVTGEVNNRSAWRLVNGLVGVSAEVTLAANSLEQVYRPMTGRTTYAVAASLGLSPKKQPTQKKPTQKQDSTEEVLTARLLCVTVLPSAEWFAVALVAGGLRSAKAVAKDVPSSVDESTMAQAELLGEELRQSMETGSALLSRKQSDLGDRVAQVLDALILPPDLPLLHLQQPNPDEESTQQRQATIQLSEALLWLKKPLTGDVLSTRWGPATVAVSKPTMLTLDYLSMEKSTKTWRLTLALPDFTLEEIGPILTRRPPASSMIKPPRADQPRRQTNGREQKTTNGERQKSLLHQKALSYFQAPPPEPPAAFQQQAPPPAPAPRPAEPQQIVVTKEKREESSAKAADSEMKNWILNRRQQAEERAAAEALQLEEEEALLRSQKLEEESSMALTEEVARRRFVELLTVKPRALTEEAKSLASSVSRWLGGSQKKEQPFWLLARTVVDGLVEGRLRREEIAAMRVVDDARMQREACAALTCKTHDARPLLAQVASLTSQRALIEGILRSSHSKHLIPRIALVLKDFYDADLIEEDIILEWHDEATDDTARKAAAPFVAWLREAEEEDDDEDEDES